MRILIMAALLQWLMAVHALSVAAADAGGLADALRDADLTVARATERAAWSDQVRTQVAAGLRRANASSTAEWHTIHDRVGWEQFRDKKLAALRKSLGDRPTHPGVPKVHITRTFSGDGFSIDNLVYETRPGWWVTGNLYRPQPQQKSQPGIVICPSHHTDKTHGELQDMGMTWARAGCLVLVIDFVGHGERRQHPFATAADFPQPFRVGHADYYFRYDAGMQLQLIGESLLGWNVWDLQRGVDVLLSQPGIDPLRIALLGAVAGGGDPAAVAAGLDERIAVAVPFNFGGPQPETKYPLPDDAETTFQYAGSGSWDSTRNLRRSAADGFLPWVIVGSVAPRGLVYAHEFRWDQERDPVWKRLQSVYAFYGRANLLSYTHGEGSVSGQSADDTHCTHIGRFHRVRIHEALRDWLNIDVTPDAEFRARRPPDDLQCWTDQAKRELQPQTLSRVLQDLAEVRLTSARQRQATWKADEQRRRLCGELGLVLGAVDPPAVKTAEQRDRIVVNDVIIERWALSPSEGLWLPVVMAHAQDRKAGPLVLVLCSQGKSRLWRERSSEIATLLLQGAVVCLIDARGIGESQIGEGVGRRSAATAVASSRLMLDGTLLGDQVRDVRCVLQWLRQRAELRDRSLAIWGESLLAANSPDASFRTPRDDDSALPAPSEPQGPLIAILTALFEERTATVYTAGGLVSWRSWLSDYLVLAPYAALVPGILPVADIPKLIAGCAPCQVRCEADVDGLNCLISVPDIAGGQYSRSVQRTSAAASILQRTAP